MSLLQKYRGAFVLLLLGVNHEPHAGSGGRSKGSSASVSSTESAASLDNPIAKKRPLPPQEGEGAGSVCVGVESGSLALAHVTPLHSRKLVKGMGPRSELQQRDSQSNRITPGSHGSVGTGGTGGTSRSHRKVTPVAVAVLDLKDKLTSVDKSLVAQLVTAWMHHIRMLDDYSVQWKGSGRESDLIRLVRLLSIFLSETLDYFTPSDCDVVVNDVTDVFYEYIYRGNTGSWHPALQMQDSLFSFLEYGRQQFESSA